MSKPISARSPTSKPLPIGRISAPILKRQSPPALGRWRPRKGPRSRSTSTRSRSRIPSRRNSAIANSVLAGDVAVTSTNAIDKAQNYELKVSIETANAFLPEGTVAATGFTDTPEYYVALINAFADSVVRRLE